MNIVVRWLGLSVPWLLMLDARVVDASGGGGAGGASAAAREVETVAWEPAMPASAPGQRFNPELAYDSARGKTLLFGGVAGVDDQTFFSDTWEWDGASWTQRTPTTSPAASLAHAMAYDSARGVTVLFGGVSGIGLHELQETWEWDGMSWIQRTPTVSPPARGSHAMVYDSARGKIVLFGGFDGQSFFSDTWEWDGTSWTQRMPTTSPPARSSHAMVYDGARGVTILFGGSPQPPSDPFPDTWEWDGTSWTQRTPIMSPSARYGHAMAYDSARSVTVLFGGERFSETWEWDGTSWAQRVPTTSPPARSLHGLAYDSSHDETVLYGGDLGVVDYGDTWLYRSRPGTDSGCGCRTAGGEPEDGRGWLGALGLALLVAQRPRARRLPGREHDLDVSGASRR